MAKNMSKLKRLATLAYILLIVVSLGVPVFKTQYTEAVSDQALLEITNLARQNNGQQTLKWNGDLSSSSWIMANDMCTQDYWAHGNPQGMRSGDLIKAEGYEFEFAGENLAKHYDSSEKVVAAWMNSPSHRDNLLKPEYTDIGTAQLKCNFQGKETIIYVSHYASR